jgi:large subunit ribosomal protein L9e
MLGGVTVSESKAQKDELILVGNDIDNVSQSGTLFWSVVANAHAYSFSSRIYPGYLPGTEQGYS